MTQVEGSGTEAAETWPATANTALLLIAVLMSATADPLSTNMSSVMVLVVFWATWKVP